MGRYEVEKELGRGSMGVVYLARDASLQRSVALKTITLPAGLPDDEVAAYRDRLLREARAAGAISHPSIVTIYDVDESSPTELPFIAME